MSAEEKSEDKKEIEDEEREKILNEENKKTEEEAQPEGEVQKMMKALEECEKDRDGKKKVPIGGIKIPGFLKSKSRDKCKDGEQDVEEVKDLLQQDAAPVVATAQKDRGGPEEKAAAGSRKPLLATIMINNPFGRKSKDMEQGGAAGLASMETLEDSSGVEKVADQVDDGMESVKLDSDDKLDVEKGEDANNAQKPFWPTHFDVHNKFHMMMCAAVIFFVLLMIVIVVAASSQQESWPAPVDHNPFVEAVTTCGPVEGRAEGGAYVFRSVPYAVPPVGERRFRPAQPLDDIKHCWNGTRVAHAASLPCLQALDNGSLSGSEDCLTLDVYTPRVSFENPVAVVVLVAAETLARDNRRRHPRAEPSPELARSKDVVLVRVNFRLGVLGFLAAEALAQSVHPPTSGNYGLSDVLVALQWLQMNIQAFNGNNKSVTLLGHGAGATLVTALCAHPQARRLFARAWVSGGSGALPQEGDDGPGEAYERYVQSLPCGQLPTVDCLQQLEARALLEKVPPQWLLPFARLGEPQHSWLVLDGVYVRDGFRDAWAAPGGPPVVVGAAKHSDVPSGQGRSPEEWDADDGRLVKEELVGGPLAQWADEALRRYGPTWRGYVSLVSDLRSVCPLAALARLRPAAAAFYVANRTRGAERLADARSDLDAVLGAHGDDAFAAAVQEMFYGFARGSPAALDTSREAVIYVDDHLATRPDYPDCSFWAAKDAVGKFARRD